MRNALGLALMLAACPAPGGPDCDERNAALEGTWDDVTPRPRGVGYQVPRPKMTLTFLGSACTWAEDVGPVGRQSLFLRDPADPGKAIDFVTVEGGRFWTTRALYRLYGDTLTIKEAALDRPRPADMEPEDLLDGRREWAPIRVYRRRAK